MAKPLDDHAQTRLATAAMFAALARTLAKNDPSFLPAFDKNLEYFYRQMEDFQSEPLGALDALRWAHELIT